MVKFSLQVGGKIWKNWLLLGRIPPRTERFTLLVFLFFFFFFWFYLHKVCTENPSFDMIHIPLLLHSCGHSHLFHRLSWFFGTDHALQWHVFLESGKVFKKHLVISCNVYWKYVLQRHVVDYIIYSVMCFKIVLINNK